MTTKTLDDHIIMSPEVVGGKPRIAGRRITVQDIVVWHDLMGLSAEEIASDYDLALSDIHAALAYYYDHRPEIDQAMKDEKAFVEAFRMSYPSKMDR